MAATSSEEKSRIVEELLKYVSRDPTAPSYNPSDQSIRKVMLFQINRIEEQIKMQKFMISSMVGCSTHGEQVAAVAAGSFGPLDAFTAPLEAGTEEAFNIPSNVVNVPLEVVTVSSEVVNVSSEVVNVPSEVVTIPSEVVNVPSEVSTTANEMSTAFSETMVNSLTSVSTAVPQETVASQVGW